MSHLMTFSQLETSIYWQVITIFQPFSAFESSAFRHKACCPNLGSKRGFPVNIPKIPDIDHWILSLSLNLTQVMNKLWSTLDHIASGALWGQQGQRAAKRRSDPSGTFSTPRLTPEMRRVFGGLVTVSVRHKVRWYSRSFKHPKLVVCTI